LLAATLVRENRVRSFHVQAALAGGCEAVEREDQRIVHQHHYADWHLVELVILGYAFQIAELKEQGCRET
jgi:hypothetical protein